MMYIIKIDDKIIQDSIDNVVINPELIEKVNGAGTFTFSVPFYHQCYNEFEELKSIVKVYNQKEDHLEFVGRLLNKKKKFDGSIELQFEGEMAYLNDVQYPPFSFSGSPEKFFEDILDYYNSRCLLEHQILKGIVTVTDKNDYIVRESQNYMSCWEAVKTKLVDMLGGYVKLRYLNGKRYLDYTIDSGNVSSQTIEFGKNILDLEEYIDATDVATVIIPLGASKENTNERVTISSVNNEKEYIKSSLVERYGWIEKVVTYDDVTLPENLFKKAQSDLGNIILANKTITTKVIDLHFSNDEIESFKIGNIVNCISKPHNINVQMVITERARNLNDPSSDTISISTNAQTTLTSDISRKDNIISDTESKLNGNWLQKVIENNTSTLLGGSGGYVMIHNDPLTKQPDSIYIMDSSDEKLAKNVILMNKNGIGYSYNGVTGPFVSAWTIDGKFNADFISAGTLKGIKIIANEGSVAGFSLTDEGFVKTTELTLKKIYTNDDLIRMNGIMSKSITPTEEDYDFYDVNEDGKISAIDYVLISNYLVPLNDDKLYTDVIINPLNLSLKDINNENSNPAIIVKYRKSNGEVLYQTSVSANRIFTNNIYCRNIEVENSIVSKKEIQIYDKTGESDTDEGGLIFAEPFNDTVNLHLLCNSGGYLALGTKNNRWYMQDIANDNDWKSAFFSRDTGSALGKSGNPWYRLYAEKSTSVTSDKRVKCDFAKFDDRYIKFVDCLDPTLYHRIGEENNPLESGFIAQEVEQAMEEVGIDKSELDIVEYDEKNDRYSLHYEQFIPVLFYYIQNKNKNYDERLRKLEEVLKCN